MFVMQFVIPPTKQFSIYFSVTRSTKYRFRPIIKIISSNGGNIVLKFILIALSTHSIALDIHNCLHAIFVLFHVQISAFRWFSFVLSARHNMMKMEKIFNVLK